MRSPFLFDCSISDFDVVLIPPPIEFVQQLLVALNLKNKHQVK